MKNRATVTPEPDASVETLTVLALQPDPVATAPELADDLDVSAQAVNKRLSTLVENGYVESKKVGAAARVYWLTREGRIRVAREALKWF